MSSSEIDDDDLCLSFWGLSSFPGELLAAANINVVVRLEEERGGIAWEFLGDNNDDTDTIFEFLDTTHDAFATVESIKAQEIWRIIVVTIILLWSC